MTEEQQVAEILEKVIPFDTQFEIIKQEVEQDDFFVEGFAATSDLDSQGDIITHQALKKAAKALLKVYTTALFNHDMDRPIGKIVEAEAVEGKGLRVKIQLSKSETDIRRKVEEGIISKFSIRGRALRIERKFDESKNVMLFIIHEIEIVEVSLVSLPANAAARVTGFERVATSEKTLVGAVIKSYKDSETGGGETTMDPKDKKKDGEEGATPAEGAAAPAEGAEGAGAPAAPAEGAEPEKPAEGGEGAEPAKPEGEETPAEAPAEESPEEKSLKDLAAKLLLATGDDAEKIKAQMAALISGKPEEKKPEATVTLSEAQIAALVQRQVSSQLAVRKGAGTPAETETETPTSQGEVKKFEEYPLGNQLVVLGARIMGRERDL